MIAFPAGVRVWIAGGATDMRRGMNTLALTVQQGLGRDPHAGEICCFRRDNGPSARGEHIKYTGRGVVSSAKDGNSVYLKKSKKYS